MQVEKIEDDFYPLQITLTSPKQIAALKYALASTIASQQDPTHQEYISEVVKLRDKINGR